MHKLIKIKSPSHNSHIYYRISHAALVLNKALSFSAIFKLRANNFWHMINFIRAWCLRAINSLKKSLKIVKRTIISSTILWSMPWTSYFCRFTKVSWAWKARETSRFSQMKYQPKKALRQRLEFIKCKSIWIIMISTPPRRWSNTSEARSTKIRE